MSLVESGWLENNINNTKILDCSWHMPNVNRNGYDEYLKEHIPGSIFFDLDKYSKNNTDLPHMLPEPRVWGKIVSSLGISNNDKIIIYDHSEVISACRCWYNFIYFGHNPNLVSVLNGGLKKWKIEGRPITDNKTKILKSNYKSLENRNLVKAAPSYICDLIILLISILFLIDLRKYIGSCFSRTILFFIIIFFKKTEHEELSI